MTEDEKARLLLIASIEGNSKFWSNQVREFGAAELVERIKSDCYSSEKDASKRIAERMKKLDISKMVDEIKDGFIITPNSQDWPAGFNDLPAPPFALVGKGNREILERTASSISIVGTRNPTQYGVRMAGEFAATLSDREWVIVSGGAFGIDSAAHRGALAVEGETIALLGSGFRSLFPSGNERLFEEIQVHGLILSEVMPSVPAAPHRFLIRNRLIAALSQGTLVVEAAHRSGSIRTARDAAELHRPVMAIPGMITSPSSEGCHRLIAERRAELVASAADVLELLQPLSLPTSTQ